MEPWVFVCVSPFVLAGLALFARGWQLYKKSLNRNNWPSTNGEVLSSGIRASQSGGSYFPEIRYRYNVNSVEYESKVVRLSESVLTGSSKRLAENRVNKYPQGQVVTVYYDPEDPDISALETEMSFSGLIFYAVLALGFWGVSCGFIYMMSTVE